MNGLRYVVLQWGSIFEANDTITAIQSGDFNSLSTWEGGVVPGNGSNVIIPKNVTVYISDQVDFMAQLLAVRVYGRFQIGSWATFTFSYPMNIMIFKGGILEDFTASHRWFVSSNSIITIYNGGSFISSQVTTIVSSLNNSTGVLNSTTYGPYTMTVDLQGAIQSYSCKWKETMRSYFISREQSAFLTKIGVSFVFWPNENDCLSSFFFKIDFS